MVKREVTPNPVDVDIPEQHDSERRAWTSTALACRTISEYCLPGKSAGAEVEGESVEARRARPRSPGQCWSGRAGWRCWAAGAVADRAQAARPEGGAEQLGAGHGALDADG